MPRMLQANRQGFFKHRYEITDGAGPVTELADFRRESCEFSLGGQRHRVARENRKRLVFHGPTGWLATADRESGKRWTIRSTTGHFELVRPSAWRSGWELHQHGRPLGTVSRKGKRSTAELPTTVDLPTQLFAYYVVLIIWERESSAAAGAAAGGGGG